MLKLFTSKHRGDLIVVSLLIIEILYYSLTSFSRGFSNQDIIILLLMTIPIGIIFVNSVVREEPFITTSQGLYILVFAILLLGGAYMINQMYGNIFSTLYFIALCLLAYYLYESTSLFRPKQQLEYISNKPKNMSQPYNFPQKPIPQKPYVVSDPTKPLQINVENAIRRFKPSGRYQYEIDYQNELYNWLGREFPVQYEVQKGSSRPDLIIKNIAIEIKGPTGNRELDTLTTKFLKYSNHYPHFIIVLFDCNFSEGHFHEIYNGIRKFAPNVIIIRK